MVVRGFNVVPAAVAADGATLYRITYTQAGFPEEDRDGLTLLKWPDLLAASHRWMYDNVQTH